MRKAIKVGGFIVALGASAGLVAAAASGTGAYFTDSHSGAINASTGSVKINTTDLNLNFTGLLPGQDQSDPVDFTATGNGPEDIWLVFPAGDALALNGPGGPNTPALGRFGHFAVTSPAGSFESYNLASPETPTSGPSCTPDANGHGGSNQQAADYSDHTVPYCPVPGAILLASNLTNGQGGEADIKFGFTKLLSDPNAQGQGLAQVAQFQIVATQSGVRPDDANNHGNTPGN